MEPEKMLGDDSWSWSAVLTYTPAVFTCRGSSIRLRCSYPSGFRMTGKSSHTDVVRMREVADGLGEIIRLSLCNQVPCRSPFFLNIRHCTVLWRQVAADLADFEDSGGGRVFHFVDNTFALRHMQV